MNMNVWYEYKKMKSAFPLGTDVILRLEPIEDYFELIWAANAVGTVAGYNIHNTLVVVLFENGITMHCAVKLLDKAVNFANGFEI